MSNDLSSFFDDGFNPNDIEPQSDFEVLPPGKYPVLIESAEGKRTRAGTGAILALTLVVVSEQYKNRKLFANINISNPSEVAQNIGWSELSALITALGLKDEEWKNPDNYLNKVVIAHVVVRNGRNDMRQNDVRTYSSPESDAVQPPPVASAPAATPAPAAVSGKPPWEQ